MGAILGLAGGGSGEAGASGATGTATAGAGGASSATGGVLSSVLGGITGKGTQSVTSGADSLDFGSAMNSAANTGNSSLNHISSATLNDFKPEQGGFLDDLGNFGKNFGLEIAKSLIQNVLKDVPGGQIIGSTLGKSFSNPTVRSLFGGSDTEVSKRDDIIKMLLKQRLGKA